MLISAGDDYPSAEARNLPPRRRLVDGVDIE
jgi:hypothetical protein